MQVEIGPKMSIPAGVWCQLLTNEADFEPKKGTPSRRIPKFYPHLLVLLVLHLAHATDLATSCKHTPAKKLRSCISTLHIRPQLATLPAFAREDEPRWNNNQGNLNKHGLSVSVRPWQQAILRWIHGVNTHQKETQRMQTVWLWNLNKNHLESS